MDEKKIKLLIVDDQEMIHRALQRALRREPYETLHAYDAAEAWAILREHPEVRGILCDHYMPGTLGLDFLMDVRSSSPDIVTMLLTAQADLNLALSAINEGDVDRLFTKPWEGPQLRAQLRKVLLDGPVDYTADEIAARAEERMLGELLPMQDEATGAFLISPPDAALP
jgi:DNA-binding NtrC family response regulator